MNASNLSVHVRRNLLSRKINFSWRHEGSPNPRVASSVIDDWNRRLNQQRLFSTQKTEYPSFRRASVAGAFGKYAEEYDRSLQDPEGFWGDAAKAIHWFQPPSNVLSQDSEKPQFHRWFADGMTNMAYNCLDVHVKAGNGGRTALIYDSPVTGVQKKFTYSELLEKVSVFAGSLRDELGVETGDRVVIYMPMIPEAIIAMVSIWLSSASVSWYTSGAHHRAYVHLFILAGMRPNRSDPFRRLRRLRLARTGNPDHGLSTKGHYIGVSRS
jgi:hypothetical protein